MDSTLLRHVFASILYIGAALYITHPLVFNLGKLSYGLGDELLIAYLHGWVVHSLQTNILSVFDANIYYPFTNTLAYSDMFFVTGIISFIPLILTNQPIAAFNTITILSFLLVGLSTYLLAVHLTRNFWASILSGFLVIFSPVFIEKSVHIQILFVPLVSLSIYFFIRYCEQIKIKYFVFFLICFILQLYISFLPGYFILIAVTLIGGIKVYKKQIAFRQLFNRKNVVVLLLTGCVTLPVIIPYFQISKEFNYVRDIRDTIHFALQPEDLIYPNSHTRLAPYLIHLLPPPEDAPPGEVKSGYLGGVFSVLSIVSLVFVLKNRRKGNEYFHSFTWMGLIGLVLSLGPFLHLGRHTIHSPFPIPLPYLLAYYILPGFQGFRNSARFEMLFILAMSVAIAILLTELLKKKKKWIKIIVYSICILGTIVEFNFPIHYVRVPQTKEFPPVYSYINTLPKDAVIIHMPIFVWNMQPYVFAENYREYYSTIHFRKMVNGASGFSPPPWQKMVTELLKTFPEEQSINKLKQLGVTHIVFHKVEYDQLYKDGFTVEGKKIENGEVVFKKLEDSKHISLQQTFGNDYVFTLK